MAFGDGSDDRLRTLVDVHVLDANELGSPVPPFPKRLELTRVGN